ncbi:MAG: ATP-binding cassette domain-containing protein [Actinomycetota bacterium]
MTTLSVRDVEVRYDDRRVLGPLDLDVFPGERWIVLGPNGSGKTTLVRTVALIQFPTAGSVELLGHRWGRVDVRELRGRVGLTSAALVDQLRPSVAAVEVVMSAANAALETWWHHYDADDHGVAVEQLDRFGVGHLADQSFASLSSGERQRVLLARAYANSPDLVVLDEPTAGLDLGGREDLVHRLDAVANDPTSPPVMMVTHHVEEIPPSFTHALLLRDGASVAAGAIDDVLTSANVSACFGLPVVIGRSGGRWSARSERRSGLDEDGFESGT